MSDQPELNREWEIDINISGLQAPTNLKNIHVPEGFYEATVKDSYINPDKNPDRVIFKLSLHGEYDGVIRTTGLGVPRGPDDNVRYYWRGLAESAGYTAAQLDSGEVSLSASSFIGKKVHIYYVPADSKESKLDNVVFLPPVVWNQQKAAFKSRSGGKVRLGAPDGSGAESSNGGGGGSSGGGGAAGSTGGGAAATKKDMLAKLGLSS
jgi:uncharacterized membrane protein YgcG